MIRFIGRKPELRILADEWSSSGAKLIILYGRRRIGKTTLLSEFFSDKNGVFYISEDVYYKLQVDDLRKYLAEFFHDEFLQNATINEWEGLFQYLPKVIDPGKRFFIVLDEFTYLIKNGRSILTGLQRLWDTFLSKTNVFLVLCGSNLGMMRDEVLSYSSPLYGRRTRDMLLAPFDFNNAMKFLNMSFEEKLLLYMTIGGIPEYLRRASGYVDYHNFVEREFGDANGYFYREPYFILAQEFREYNTYFSILNAISFGKNKPSEIAGYIGMESKRLYPYLENLMKLMFISKATPIDDRKGAGHYELTDSMMQFWFNYVFLNREFIERGSNQLAFDYPAYFGRIFEKFVRNELFKFLYPTFRIGTWWYKDTEIDVVAISQKNDEIVFCECKWKDRVDHTRILPDLKRKSEKFLQGKKVGKISYQIVARSFRNKTHEEELILTDLSDMEEIFTRFSRSD